MTKYVIAYLSTAIVFFGLDFLWLSMIATRFYRRWIGDLLLEQPDLRVAGIFYVFYVAGIVYFAVAPAVNTTSWSTAVIGGALLGALAYGTYDMTNLATLKGWSVSVSLMDIAWGTVLTMLSALSGFAITTWLFPQSG